VFGDVGVLKARKGFRAPARPFQLILDGLDVAGDIASIAAVTFFDIRWSAPQRRRCRRFRERPGLGVQAS